MAVAASLVCLRSSLPPLTPLSWQRPWLELLYPAVPASSQSKKSHTQHSAVIKDNQQWLAIVRLSAIGELVPAPITEVGYGLPYRNYRAWQSLGLSLSHLIGCMKRIVHELYCTKPRPHAVSLAGAQVNEVGGWWCACDFLS